jgi:hypothetical protein
VESVAWISERKDVLSTFFGLLALISYVRYTERLGRLWYLLSLLFFIFGLMAKPMLVTLPFVLLLLDYWPLGRIKFNSAFGLQSSDQTCSVFSLLFEKIPFFILTAASCGVTYYAQQSGGSLMPSDMFTLGIRIANAVVSYVAYIGKMFWPAQLAVFYPYPDSFALWQVAAAAAVLVRHIYMGDGADQEASVFGGGLVMVFWNAGAGYRPGAGWRPGHGGSLYLCAVDRAVYNDRLGRCRTDRPLAA